MTARLQAWSLHLSKMTGKRSTGSLKQITKSKPKLLISKKRKLRLFKPNLRRRCNKWRKKKLNWAQSKKTTKKQDKLTRRQLIRSTNFRAWFRSKRTQSTSRKARSPSWIRICENKWKRSTLLKKTRKNKATSKAVQKLSWTEHLKRSKSTSFNWEMQRSRRLAKMTA